MPSQPHGGVLIEKILRGRQRAQVERRLGTLPSLDLTERQAREVENLATGVYSPLSGFMKRKDLESVLREGRLAAGTAWTIPIVLDVTKEEATRCRKGPEVALSFGGTVMAILRLEEEYRCDKEEYARQIFGTTDMAHPGVAFTAGMKEVLLGGGVDLIESAPSPFAALRLTPKETRARFAAHGWSRVVGFQTRNIPHLGHEALQKAALNLVDGLFINPLVGGKKAGDFEDAVIVAAYEALLRHYFPRERALLAVLQGQMRYAGPREAIFHAIVRKNFGCTHFIVGRDHAGVGSFYPPYAAQEIFSRFPDLGIAPLFFSSFFHCRRCNALANEKTCPHPASDRIDFSGTGLREAILNGRPIDLLLRPEVAEAIRSSDAPFRRG